MSSSALTFHLLLNAFVDVSREAALGSLKCKNCANDLSMTLWRPTTHCWCQAELERQRLPDAIEVTLANGRVCMPESNVENRRWKRYERLACSNAEASH
jgi:hypothetical protein